MQHVGQKKTTIIITNYVGWGSELFNKMLLFPSVAMVPPDIAATFTELSFEGEPFDDLVALAMGTFDIVNNPTMSLIVWYSMFFTCGDHVMPCEHNIAIYAKVQIFDCFSYCDCALFQLV